MENKENTVNTTQPAVVETAAATVVQEDLEAKFGQLEAEKNKAIEEAANWKLAALKAKGKVKEENFDDEGEEDKIRRIATETLAGSRLAEITREQDAIIKKALKENKELKLASLNRTTTPPAALGSHTEGQTVQDTLVTPEQIAAFKARHWTDKDIERYKANLRKVGGIGGR